MPKPDETITMTIAEYRTDMEFAAKIGGDIAHLREFIEQATEFRKSLEKNIGEAS